MGAIVFTRTGYGESVENAFRSAVEEAELMNGIGGYTGTIAEKSSFKVINRNELQEGETEYDLAYRLIEASDPRVDDKWGPAGVISTENKNEWLFFGWASC